LLKPHQKISVSRNQHLLDLF